MHLIYYSCYMISLNGIKLENYLNVIEKNGTRDKVWLDDYCEKRGVQATTVLRRIYNNKAYDQRRNILNTMILSIHFLNVRRSIQYWKSN